MSDSEFFPFFLKTSIVIESLAGAMVARLPTEQEAVGSSPTSGFFFLVVKSRKVERSIRPENSFNLVFLYPIWCSR